MKDLRSNIPYLIILAIVLLGFVLLLNTNQKIDSTPNNVDAQPVSLFIVSPTGNDNNNGSEENPWKTITHASNLATPGSVVKVKAGAYTGDIHITKSGSPNQPTVFEGESGTKLITDKSQADASVLIEADFIQFKNFDVEGNFVVRGHNNVIENNTVHDSWFEGGIYLSASQRDSDDTTNIVVKNNVISHAIKAGIYVEGQNHLIEGNDISHTMDHDPAGGNLTDADGIRFFGSGHTFQDNYVHDLLQSENINAPHIDILQTYEDAHDIIFNGNTFHNPNTTGSNRILMLENQSGPGVVKNLTWVNNVMIFSDDSSAFMNFNRKTGQNSIENITVINNTFYYLGTSGDGAASFANITGVTMKNNLLINVASGSVEYAKIKDGSSGIDISNNAVWSTNGQAPSLTTYPGDIWMKDPLVLDLAQLNFHLTSNSPLLDAGVNHAVSLVDKDGISRPQGTVFDIGAYEYFLGTPPTENVDPTIPEAVEVQCGSFKTNNFAKLGFDSTGGASILDFSEFAKIYLADCINTQDLEFPQCGPRDTNSNNNIDLADFSKFATYYKKDCTSLAQ